MDSHNALAWDSVRRIREPVAWALLVLTGIGLLIGVWELLGLPGTPPIEGPDGVLASTFALRAVAVAPQFVTDGIFALPIFAVILVTFAGGLTDNARQAVRAACAIQAVTLALGLICWVGALGAHARSGLWFIGDARELAIVAVGLIFTIAVSRSQALQPPANEFQGLSEERRAP